MPNMTTPTLRENNVIPDGKRRRVVIFAFESASGLDNNINFISKEIGMRTWECMYMCFSITSNEITTKIYTATLAHRL